jgi:hypothetical protein
MTALAREMQLLRGVSHADPWGPAARPGPTRDVAVGLDLAATGRFRSGSMVAIDVDSPELAHEEQTEAAKARRPPVVGCG